MATTLEMQQKLLDILSQIEKMLENITGSYQQQLDLVSKISGASKGVLDSLDTKKMSEMAKGFGDLEEGFEKFSDAAEKGSGRVSDAMRESGDSVKDTEGNMSKFGRTADNSGGFMSKFGEIAKGTGDKISKFIPALGGIIGGFTSLMSFGGLSGMIGGIGTAFEFLSGVAGTVVSALTSVGGVLFNVASAVIGFPFKVFGFFTKMAQKGGGPSELAGALEKVREEFGYLNKSAGGAIYDLAKNMGGPLASTGLSVAKVFGTMAERVEFFLKYAQNLGETADAVFRTLSASSAEALGAFNKALGLTAAGQKAVAQRSLSTGRDINDINLEIANFAMSLSDSFGVSMKTVSRDVGDMMADFEHFGNLSVQELTQTSVFARRLGIEVKSLGKLVDKFMNFEDSAKSAAQLSQAFGMNVDAFKLMQEQDPGKKLQMLRDAFFATGKSIETMTAQERRLLASQTGLGESELALAFSQKSRSMSYDDIKKKGDASKKSQLSQAEALDKLAGAIERLNKGGGGGEGGFLDKFFQGFVAGIQKTREFRELMRALSRSLAIVFRAGVAVGRMFVDLFPGVRDFFKGLTAMFSPRIFTAFMTDVKAAFKSFFGDILTDPVNALPKLLDNLKKAFTGWFSAAGPGGSQMLKGVQKFVKAAAYILFSGIKLALLSLGDIFKQLGSGSFFTSQIGQFINGIFKDVVKAFHDVFDGSGPAIKKSIFSFLNGLGRLLQDTYNFIWPFIKGMFDQLLAFIDDSDFFSELMESFLKSIDDIGNFVQNAIDDFIDDIVDRAAERTPTIFLKAGEMLPEAMKKLTSGVEKLASSETLNKVMKTGEKLIGGVGKAVIEKLPGVVKELGTSVSKIGTVIVDKLKEVGMKLVQSDILGQLITGIKDLLRTLAEMAVTELPPLINKIIGSVVEVANGLMDKVGSELDKLIADIVSSDAINEFGQKLMTGIGNIFNEIVARYPEFKEKFVKLFNKVIDGAIVLLKELPNKIAKFFEDNKDKFADAGKKLGGFIGTAIGDILKLLGSSIIKLIINLPEILRGLQRLITSIWNTITGIIKGLITGIGDKLAEAFPSIAGPIRGLFNFIANAFEGTANFIRDIWNGIMNFITGGIQSFINGFRGLANALPAPIRRLFGLGNAPATPPPAPANNPAVQQINQAVQASRTGGAEINRNLTNALRAPAAAAAAAPTTPAALPDQVNEIRNSITSAQEIARIDPAAATRSLEKLRQFATTFGPQLQQTSTTLGNAISGINLGAFNDAINNIKGILGGISEINGLLVRRTSVVRREQFAPFEASLTAISTFAATDNIRTIATSMGSAETAARISGIQNTSNAIREMVQAINSTSAELARLNPVRIQTNLQHLGTNLGLGNNAAYTITNRNFTVTVNVDVHMDAKDLEKVMLENRTTRIQHTPTTGTAR
jgi:phage-related protein